VGTRLAGWTPMTIPAPEPGIYLDIPEDQYHLWNAVSKSDLVSHVRPMGKIGRNMLIGSVLHSMILEGAIATSERYFTAREYNLRKNSEKEAMADDEKQSGKIAIRPSEKQKLADMYHAVIQNEHAMAIISGEGQNEVSITGHLLTSDKKDAPLFDTLSCGRLDMIRQDCIADLKTTACLDVSDFKNSCAKFTYNVQSAYYADLHAQVTGESYRSFIHICVSTRRHPDTDEHEVWVEPMGWDAIAYGRQHYRDLLTLLERERNGKE